MAADDQFVDAVRAAEALVAEAERRVLASQDWRAALNDASAAYAARADADRALARARGEEAAVPYPWEPAWNRGAPSPHVVSSGHRTMLLYLAREPDPDWDGSHANVVDPGALASESLALVEIEGCYAHRFGGPNDEVFEGHPLARRGFEGQGAYEIERSRWLATEQATNAVHPQYDPARWTTRRHFMLAFHDNVFECLAVGFRITRIEGSFQQVLARMVESIVR